MTEETTDQNTQEQTLNNDIRSVVESAGAPSGLLLVEKVRWLASERQRLIPLADDGKAYRENLIAEALVEQVRAFGEDGEETYRALLTAAPIATIKRMRDDWKKIGDGKFTGGRQTVDENETPEEEQRTVTAEPEAPSFLYAT